MASIQKGQPTRTAVRSVFLRFFRIDVLAFEIGQCLYTLVVLKDLGVDPASKEARKMIDRVDKRLVFKPLNDRPFLHGEIRGDVS